MILLVLQALNFYTDPVIYRSAITFLDTATQQTTVQNLFYIELNCAIPYQELYYEQVNDTITGRLNISFKLTNTAHTDSLMDQLYRKFTIPSFSQAARDQMIFIVQFGLYIPQGDFDYTVEMTSGEKSGTAQGRVSVSSDAYHMSDILLASSITKDTIGAYLAKGDLKVIPHPSHIFDENYKTLYVYYEVYDIEPDSTILRITYKITDTLGKVMRKVVRRMEKQFAIQAVNLGLNIEGFPVGKYLFAAEISDSSLGNVTAKQTPFEIRAKPKKMLAVEDLPYYEDIEYFVSPEEYKHYKSLIDEGRAVYLKKFWEKHNYREIAERFEYADAHYAEGMKSGSKTDRGRVYIKVGPPDEVERSTIEVEVSRPYEEWQYYNGIEFIFVDIRGTNEYTLVWTNSTVEKKQPTLYMYLPSTKQDEIKDKE